MEVGRKARGSELGKGVGKTAKRLDVQSLGQRLGLQSLRLQLGFHFLSASLLDITSHFPMVILILQSAKAAYRNGVR